MIPFVTEYITGNKSVSLETYLDRGGFQGLKKALQKSPRNVIEEIKKSGLRGRGGAYFPTGIKWESFANAEGQQRYIICNGDEGEPGTFKDRYLLEFCCWQVLEGMIIAAYATGTRMGFLYLRGEYSELPLQDAVKQLKKHNLLGEKIGGIDFSFDIELRSGAGSYICGEETALLESLEGKRGVPRNKPPIPAIEGLWGVPTLINNVETFANIPQILKYGIEHFQSYGTPSMPGTKLICLSGAVENRGVFEVPVGISLQDIFFEIGGGGRGDGELRFVHLGGLTGICLLPEEMERLTYDMTALRRYGASMGTGAIYFASDQINLIEYFVCAFEFFQRESCGKCTPCREGTKQIGIELKNLTSGFDSRSFKRILRIASAMKECSACGMGQAIPVFLRSALQIAWGDLKTYKE